MLILWFCALVFAQEMPSSLPYSQKIRRIEGRYFTLIYPQTAELQAQQMADSLASVETQLSLGFRPIHIVLNDQLGTGNAAISFLPRRGAFSLLPTANEPLRISHSGQWHSLLAVHELQHVQQMSRSYKNGGWAPHLIFGEIGWAIGHTFSNPPWFVEGEAVLLESRLTLGGRGRSPAFVGQLMALHDRSPLSVNQMIVGSYRQPIVDHYRTGWLLVNHGFSQYGEAFWPNIAAMSTRSWFWPFPIERAIKRQTGLSLNVFYQQAMAKQAVEWNQLRATRPEAAVSVLVSPQKNEPMVWYHPHPMPDESIIAVRKGPGALLQLVRVWPNGEQEIIRHFGLRNHLRVGFGQQTIVFDEVSFHPMDRGRSFSDLYAMDMDGENVRRLTRGEMHSAAIVFDADSKAASIQRLSDGSSHLVVRMLPSGKVKQSYPLPQGDLFDLQRVHDGFVFVQRLDPNGNRLLFFDPQTQQTKALTDWTWNQISAPLAVSNQYLLFHYASSTGDEIRALDRQQNRLYRVVARPYGAYAPSIRPDGETIVFTEVVYGGTQIVESSFSPSDWQQLPPKEPVSTFFKSSLPPPKIVPKQWESTPYGRWRGLFHIHSWVPTWDIQSNGGTFAIQSRNVRDSMLFDVQVGYNGFESGFWGGGEVSYQEFWPVLSVNGVVGQRQVLLGQNQTVRWFEQRGLMTVAFPFYLHRGRWERDCAVSLSGGVVTIDDFFTDDATVTPVDLDLFSVGTNPTMSATVEVHNLARQTPREITHRWGQSLSVAGFGVGGDLEAFGLDGRGKLYFPGFGEVHHFTLDLGYRYRSRYPFRSDLPFVRGYEEVAYNHLLVSKVDYQFAVASPDLLMGRWFGLRRISSGVFFDHGFALLPDQQWQSVGGQIVFEVNLLRFPRPFTVGFEVGKRLTTEGGFIGLIVR